MANNETSVDSLYVGTSYKRIPLTDEDREIAVQSNSPHRVISSYQSDAEDFSLMVFHELMKARGR